MLPKLTSITNGRHDFIVGDMVRTLKTLHGVITGVSKSAMPKVDGGGDDMCFSGCGTWTSPIRRVGRRREYHDRMPYGMMLQSPCTTLDCQEAACSEVRSARLDQVAGDLLDSL